MAKERAGFSVLVKVLMVATVGGASALIAYQARGMEGLEGAGVGLSIGAFMCLVSHFLLGWAKRAQGQALLAAMLGSMLASFGIMIVVVLILAAHWREIVEPAALTALAFYLVYRFLEAFQVKRVGGSYQGLQGKTKPAVGETLK